MENKRETVYNVLKDKTGYKDSFDDFSRIIDSDENARNKVYNVLKDKTGYKDSFDDFSKFMGIGAVVPPVPTQNLKEPVSSIESDDKRMNRAPVQEKNEVIPSSRFVQGKGKGTTVFGVPYSIYMKMKPETQSYYYQKALDDEKEQSSDLLQDQITEGKNDINDQLGEIQNRDFEEKLKFQNEHPFLSAIMDMSQGSKFVHTGVDTSQPRVSDLEAKDLHAAYNKLDSAQEKLEESKRKGKTNFAMGMLRGVGSSVFNPGTWDSGLTDMLDSGSLLKAVRDKEVGNPMSHTQNQLLDAAAIDMVVNENFSGDLGRGYKAGKVAGESVPFMLEFVVNPASGLGETATKSIVKRGIQKFGKDAMKSTLKKIEMGAVRAATDLAGAGIMSATTGLGRVIADTQGRITGNVQHDYDDSGYVRFSGTEGGESLGTSLVKAYGANVIENYSEMFGNYFSPLTNAAGRIAGRGIEKIGLSKVNRFIGDIRASDWAKTVNDFEKQAQWNGNIGEYAEEVVGNIMNALTVGDQTLDNDSSTGVFNLDNNIDTLLGVSIMGGFLSGVKTVGYRTPKYQAHKALEISTTKASGVFGEKWEGVRDAINEADELDIVPLLSSIYQSNEYTTEQKQAAINYASSLKTFQGTNLADVRRKTDGDVSDVQLQAENSFDNGYGLISPQDKHDALLTANARMDDLKSMLGAIGEEESEEIISSLTQKPSETLLDLISKGYSDNIVHAAVGYINSKAQYDGIIENVRDGIDNEITTQIDYIDKNTHKDGNMYNATMKVDDRNVYVTGGDIIMLDDGSGINHEKSDGSIVIRDAKTGEIEMVDVRDILSMGTSVNAEQHKSELSEQIRQDYAQRAADEINGILPFTPGDVYDILNEETGVVEKVAVQEVEGDFVTIAGTEGKKVQTTKGEVQTLVDRARMLRFKENFQDNNLSQNIGRKVLADGRIISATSSNESEVTFDVLDHAGNIIDSDVMTKAEYDSLRSFEDEVDTELGDDGLPIINEESVTESEAPVVLSQEEIINENGTSVNGGQVPEGVSQETEAIPAQTEEYQEATGNEVSRHEGLEGSAIPVDDKGNLIYHKAPVELTIADLNDGNLTPDEVDDLVDANKEEAAKQLKKISGKPPKIGTNKAMYLEEKRKWADAVADMDSQVAYWNEVETQLQVAREQTGDAANVDGLDMPDLQQASYKRSGEATADDIKAMGEPMNGEELAAQLLASGRLPLLQNDYMRETGYGRKEVSGMFGGGKNTMFRSKVNGGMTIEQAGEQLMLADLEAGTNFFDQNDPNAGRNAIIDVLSSARTRGDLTSYIKRNREVIAERERQAELEAYEQTIAKLAEASHMTSEEFIAFEENIAQMLEERLKDVSNEEIKGIFAELYLEENERIRESNEVGTGVPEGEERAGSNEGSLGILSEEWADDARASERSAGQPNGNAEIREPGNSVSSETVAVDGRKEVAPVFEKEAPTFIDKTTDTGENQSDLQNDTAPLQDVGSSSVNKDSEDFENKQAKSEFVAPSHIEGESLLDYAGRVNDAHVLHKEEQKVDTNPAEAQKEAGNYRKGHVKIGGYDITIENPKGSVRRGVDVDGKSWETPINNTYGYFRGTKGKDGDHIDVFLGDNLEPESVYVVDQMNEDGSFDEHKVMYGFDSIEEARDAYLSNYEDGWQGLGEITGVPRDVFDAWLGSGTKKQKPFAEYSSVLNSNSGHTIINEEYHSEDGSSILYTHNGNLSSKQGEFCHVERVFSESGVFSFSGKEKIESADDVAYIFKELENASVENSFAVLVKDNKPTIVHLGMGSFTSTIANTASIKAAYSAIGADSIYFVHNHPSGNLKCSRQDIAILKGISEMFESEDVIVQDGVIINTKSGKYGTFDLEGGIEETKRPDNQDEIPLKLYAFDRLVFSKDYDASNLSTIMSSDDIAALVSSQRLGERDKVSYMILDNANHVLGNIHTEFSSIKKNESTLSDEIARNVIRFGGTSAAIYGDFDMKEFSPGALNSKIKRLSAGNVQLLDCVSVDGANARSAVDDGLMDPKESYGNENRIEDENVFESAERIAEKEKINRDYDKALEAINEFAEKYAGAGEVVLVNSKKNIKDQLGSIGISEKDIAELEKIISDGEAAACYSPKFGKIVVIGKNIPGDRLNSYLWHENTHKALGDLYGDNLREVIEPIFQWLNNKHPNNCARIKELYFEESDSIQKEECIVRYFEDMFSSKGSDALQNAIKCILDVERRNFFERLYNKIVYGTREEKGTSIVGRYGVETSRENMGMQDSDDTRQSEETGRGVQEDGIRFRLGETSGEEHGRPTLIDAYKKRILEQNARIASLERKLDSYVSSEELSNEVIEEIKKEIGSDVISEIGKGELNSLLLQVKNAKTKKSLEKIFMNVKRIALVAQSRKLQREMDKLLALKVQDVNGKNMSIAKNVDDSTRRIFSFIRGKLSDIKRSGLEDDILYLKRDSRKHQDEIKRLERVANEAKEGREKDEAMADIEEHRRVIEGNKGRIQELRDEKGELERQIANSTDIDVEKEMAALNEKIDKAAQGEAVWTQGDNERMVALNIISGQIMNKSHDFEVQSIELDIQQRLLNNSNRYKDRMGEASENKRRVITNAINENRRQVVALERLINDTRSMQVKQLQMTIEQLEELISNGKNSLLQRKEEEIKRKSKLIGNAIRTVEGKPIDIYDKKSGEEGVLKKFFSAPLGSFEYMCKRVNTKTLGKDGFLYKYFVEGKDGVMKSYDTYVIGMRELRDRLDEKSKEIFGKKYAKMWTLSDEVVEKSGVHLCDTKLGSIGYGVKYEKPLSKGQAMYVYQVWKMNDGRTKLEMQGFDEESIAEIRDFIGDDYIGFADWIQEELLPDLREKYNAKYIDMYGTSLAEIKDYIPLRIVKKSTRQESDLSEDKERKKTLEDRAGSLINRVVNTKPVDITMSAFDVLFEHGRQMEEWNAYARVRRDLDAVLSNITFRNQLDANTRGSFGNFYDAAAVATKAYHPDQNKFMDEVLGKISKGIVGGNIAWRLSTALKQVLSAPAFWGYSQSPYYMRALIANTAKMPVTFKWCMENIPSFRERVESGTVGNEKLEEKSISKYLDKYIETGMIPNKLVDAATCSIGAKSIFDYRYSRLTKQGIDEEGARNQALMDADIYYNQTQQSSHPAFLSPMQMSRSIMDRMMTTYQNSNIGYVRKVLASYYDLTRSLKWNELKKNYTDMYVAEGLSAEDAERKAYGRLLNENRKTAFEAVLFGWGLNLLWNIGSRGLLGLFAGDGDDDDNNWAKGISFFLTSPIKGMPGGNLLESIASGYGMNPILVYDELNKFMKEIKYAIDEYGLISPEIAYATLEKLSRYAGVDLEVLGNVYLGVEGMARDGALSDDKMIDFMYMLNSPKSSRDAVAKELYKDESLESFAEKVARANKYIPKRDSWEKWVPGAKDLNKRRKNDIKKEYERIHMTKEEKDADDERKIADKHRRKLKELEDDPFALADYIDGHQKEHKIYRKYW